MILFRNRLNAIVVNAITLNLILQVLLSAIFKHLDYTFVFAPKNNSGAEKYLRKRET